MRRVVPHPLWSAQFVRAFGLRACLLLTFALGLKLGQYFTAWTIFKEAETNQVITRKQAPAQSRVASRYARPSWIALFSLGTRTRITVTYVLTVYGPLRVTRMFLPVVSPLERAR